MARTSKTAIFWSFAAGVVVSLIITAGVFIWVNNAPIPFVSKVQQVSSSVDERLLDGKSIDPNEKLYAAGQGEEQRQGVATVNAAGAQDNAEVINTERFWVQAGEFASNDEAESMRASIAFIGLDAQISSASKAGSRVPAGSLVSLTFARAPLPTDAPPVEAPPANDQDPARAEAVRKVVIKETKPVTIPTKLPARDETQAAEPAEQPAQPETPPAAAVQPAQPKQQPQQPAQPSGPQKTAKVRYQVPPLAKPLSLKIELMDEYGTRVLKDGTAKSGEYISMNVPYSGEARVTIYLGGEFVWQDRYN